MDPEILAARRPVWIALADLFLDTDVRTSYPYIALIAARSPYSLEELTAIFRDEVSPVVAPNLLSVAGEWAGFGEKWLVSRITARYEHGSRSRGWRPVSGLADDDWKRVAGLVTVLRRTDPADWEQRKKIWSTLSRLFVMPDVIVELSDLPVAGLDEIWQNEIWPGFAFKEDLVRKNEINASYETSRAKAL